MKIYKKILEARQTIKESKLQKSGKNTFSNYDYFTPTQVSALVNEACNKHNLLTIFNLKKDELGYFGELILIDVETSEQVTSQMRTEKPSIKATNETQQMGGCETYTKRYMLMSAFDIADNTLDFDSQDNTPKKVVAKKEQLTEKHPSYEAVKNALKSGNYTLADVEKKYELSNEIKTKLNEKV